MIGDLDNIWNVFVTADVYLQFSKVHFTPLRRLIYQINSIELSLYYFCQPIYSRDHPMMSFRGFPLSPIGQ